MKRCISVITFATGRRFFLLAGHIKQVFGQIGIFCGGQTQQQTQHRFIFVIDGNVHGIAGGAAVAQAGKIIRQQISHFHILAFHRR